MARSVAHTVTVTTASNGVGAGYTPEIDGIIEAILYTKVDFAAGVDFVIKTNTTQQTLWSESDVNSSTTQYPIKTCDGTDGAEVATEYTKIRAYGEKVLIAVTQGGDTKTGTFVVLTTQNG